MPDVKKPLFQSAPLALTLTDVYTVPALTSLVVSYINICNRGASDTTIRISVAIAGAADDVKQYQHYDLDIPAHDTYDACKGMLLGVGDVIRVYAHDATVSFCGYGIELS